jgi:energy-coupling factor transport system permease protein
MYYGSYSQLDSFLHRVTPSAKLVVAASIMLAVTLVFDPVTPALLVGLALMLLRTLGRISLHTIGRALWPAIVAALGFFWVAVAFPRANEAATVVAQLGPLAVTSEALWRGGAISLRVLCFAVYSMLFVLTTDPTDVMLALVQHWRVPASIAYAALAAYRFVPLFATEAESIRLAHRVRGLGEGRGLGGRVEVARRFAIPLLASAIRRAERVAIAMESKGFDGHSPRTYFRTLHWSTIDVLFLVAMLAAFAGIFALSRSLGFLQLWDGTTF